MTVEQLAALAEPVPDGLSTLHFLWLILRLLAGLTTLLGNRGTLLGMNGTREGSASGLKERMDRTATFSCRLLGWGIGLAALAGWAAPAPPGTNSPSVSQVAFEPNLPLVFLDSRYHGVYLLMERVDGRLLGLQRYASNDVAHACIHKAIDHAANFAQAGHADYDQREPDSITKNG